VIRVRPARPADAEAVAPRLRAADLREIRAVTAEAPISVLRGGIAASDPCHAVVGGDDAAVGLFGVCPEQAGSGVVWLLGTDALVDEPRIFLRHSRAWVGELLARYARLWNMIDARNEVHLRWLGWCGFSIVRTVEDYGVERRRFHEIARTRG